MLLAKQLLYGRAMFKTDRKPGDRASFVIVPLIVAPALVLLVVLLFWIYPAK